MTQSSPTNDAEAIVTAVTAVSSVADPLGIGQSVAFTLTTSQAVTVSGSPVLTLSNGAAVTYNATASTGTSLVFDYTVTAGQDTSDLKVSGLTLNDASIAVPAITSFAEATSYAAGSAPYSVAVADVNGDGHLDLLVADLGGGVSVLLGNGSGGLTAATSYAAGSTPGFVAVADVDGDGHPDLIVADRSGGVDVLLGNGSGGFAAATSYAAGSNPVSVAVADVNDDGRPDLVVADENNGVVADESDGVDVLLGNGSGGFAEATSYAAGSAPYSVAVADVNGDGHPDLLIADQGGGVDVLLGDGLGSFATTSYNDAGSNPISVAVADVNGDGHSDLVVADVTGGVDVLLGNGSGGFAAAISYAAGSNPTSVAVADVNDDGHPDLVVADVQGGVDVLLNSSQAARTFAAASVTTAAGNDTGLVVDATRPVVTAVLASDTGSSATDSLTSIDTLSGTAEAGGLVTVSNGRAVLGTATVAKGGTWSFTPTGLADGSYVLTTSEADAAGNTGSASVGFTLETTAPMVTAALAVDTGSSATDGITSNDALAGTAYAGSIVTISNGTTVLGTTTAGTDGSWGFTPTGLVDGNYTLTTSETDTVGNTGIASVGFILDTAAPKMTATLAVDTGSSATDGITADDTLTGTAEAGGVVTIRNGDTLLGTTTATASGHWSLIPIVLLDGVHELTATEAEAAGNTGSAKLGFTLDTTAPAVTASLAVDTGSSATDGITTDDALTGTGQAGGIVTISSDNTILGTATVAANNSWSFAPTDLAQGIHTLTASETDTAGNSGTAQVSFALDTIVPKVLVALGVDTGSSATDGITRNDALVGTVDAGGKVVVSNSATVLGTTTADASGHWDFTPASLADGGYTLTASETDVAGNTGTANVSFTLHTTAPTLTVALASDTGSSPTDGVTTNDSLFGTAEAGGTITVSSGSTVLGTTTAGADGSWSYMPAGLADGSYTLTASETDAADNTGAAAVSLTLDTAAPVVSAALASDTSSSDSDVTTSIDALSGTAEAGSTIAVSNGSTALGSTTVRLNGHWSFAPAGLADGGYTLTASETDAAGNTGSAQTSFILDRAAPEAPTLEQVATTTPTAQPVLIGTAEAGSMLSLFDGNTVLGITTATTLGSYSFTVPAALATGSHTLTATMTDLAGNASAASAVLAVTVNDDDSYIATAAPTATGTVVIRAYDSSGQYSSVVITDETGLLLQSVTPATTLRNIYDTNGTLIGTVTEAGSATGAAAPDFTTERLVLGADTTTDSTGSHVTLLSENHSLTLGGNDVATIDSGDDTISAGSGSVSVSGGSGSLLFNAGSGTNTVSGGSGTLSVVGGSGGGLYAGGSGAGNVLQVGSGNTTLLGGSGHDQISGGAGNSTIVGSTGGSDTLTGGSGTNQITATQNETVFGGSGQSTVFAHAGGNNLVVGTSGNDQMDAEGSGNAMFGGSGNDTMFGGSGTSTMVGGAGTALMVADTGDTEFVGGSGQSTVWSGTGNDVIWTSTGQMHAVESKTGSDTVILGSGSSTVYGGLSQEVYDIINGQSGGSHTISGFKVGTDTINPIGYGSSYTQQTVGGSTVLSLADGTTITLLDVSRLNSGTST